jgi:hypothetical protein
MKDTFAVSNPILTDCKPGYSFFFNLIRQECAGTALPSLHRICTLMRKMGVQSFTREELHPNQEIEDEREAAAIRTGGAVGIKAVRFTFFRNYPGPDKWLELQADDILGYAVLVTLTLPAGPPRCYILESVVKTPSFWIPSQEGKARPEGVTNYYVHNCREFETSVGTTSEHRNFSLKGSFFSQQNDLTHVCAHAALRMAINSSPAASDQKLTNKRINEELGICHDQKRVGKYSSGEKSVGLESEEIVEVIKKLGWNEQSWDFENKPAIDFAEFIYPLIESGLPVILGIRNPWTAHVLAVLGHTLNSDRWIPEARHGYGSFPISPYISTSAWVDHFIVNDDNYGMYVTLPTEPLRNILVPKFNPNLHAALAIGLVPTDVTISGYAVEQSAASLARKLVNLITPAPANRWLLLLKEMLKETGDSRERGQHLVCRTLLRSKENYLEVMNNVTDDQEHPLAEAEKQLLENSLPSRFWVTEITVPNLYTGNKRKLGDIVTATAVNEQQYLSGEMFHFCWLPGISLSGPGLKNGPHGWSLMGHIPLLRGASQERQSLEW